MRKKYENFAQFHKIINIVYMAIIFGLLIFMTIVYASTKESFFSFTKGQTSLYIGLAFALIALIASSYIYKIILRKVAPSTLFTDKLTKFFSAFIVKIAILEGAGFFNILGYLNTGNKAFLIFAALSILGILLAKPTPEMLIKDLSLSLKEQEYIDYPDREIK